MSTEEVAAQLNEVPNKSITGLILGMAVKYGLPSLCCIWLFYVIWCNDKIIYDMSRETTQALVQSSAAQLQLASAQERQNNAIQELSRAINDLSRTER